MASKIVSTSSRLFPISRATFASSSRLPRPVVRAISIVLPHPPSSRFQSRHLPSRRYASAAAVATPSPSADVHPIPSRPSIKVIPPSLEEIKEEGYLDDDVQLLPAEEAYLNITPDALQQLVNITSREPPELIEQDKLALRVGVESGGCHGYQYTMALTEERGVDDYVLQPEGVHSIPVVVDLVSFGLLKGATIHFATELIGSSFRIQDNPQAKQGGACGCGVSWEAA
ncbi:hypothetical protein L486_02809 [Kwoniella mangroviensis CBS 10435]|uniref:Core domain-containing protein n=1 Tax=Kwoniella mangroviensis CBS 10435 TaxID=1331196 RepID=A0A1B9IX83_9TREE|nr:uncharacterized protein I203_01355 [Kwoniella mangroviensis CBS 8507]OCF60129.1 hypothetical protein L486_02809 [Kwoniella mangroviensis CBS 10435]OCF69498.1 hypothetical protein I203_01355 [Kwoniella mangroviensis CBS 8507]OCF72294.1 hypothetical protein I204_06673 [Kwoniella mangroviensis CBS 8886]